MEGSDAYLDKFSDSGKRVLKGALNESHRRDHKYISPEYILYALIKEETELFDSVMHNFSVDSNSVRSEVETHLEKSRRHTGKGFRISPETTKIFKFSMDKARSENRRVIEASDILYVLITDKYSVLNKILQNLDRN